MTNKIDEPKICFSKKPYEYMKFLDTAPCINTINKWLNLKTPLRISYQKAFPELIIDDFEIAHPGDIIVKTYNAYLEPEVHTYDLKTFKKFYDVL